MFVIQHTSIRPHFTLIEYLGFKGNKHNYNFNYVAMPMMTSQILKSVYLTKTEKSRYLENETFLLQIKKTH